MNKSESKYYNTSLLMDEALLILLEKKEFEFIEAEEKLLKAIQKSDLEEVKIFEKEFLPSFHKTLDQMKK